MAAASIRGTDRIGRYGGEEFLLVLMATSLEMAAEPLNRIREALGAFAWDVIDRDLRVTITIGAAQLGPQENAQHLIRRADMALYLGKEAGRDRVVVNSGMFQVVADTAAASHPA